MQHVSIETDTMLNTLISYYLFRVKSRSVKIYCVISLENVSFQHVNAHYLGYSNSFMRKQWVI